MPSHQRHLEYRDALDHIRVRIREIAPSRPHVVVGVTGPVGAGKSHVASALSPCIVSTDDYLPDYDTTPEHLRDLPEWSDLPRLAADLARLASGRPARLPAWSFHEHRRTGEREALPGPVIVCEGLHALHPTVRPSLDLLVFVEAPAAARWQRVEHRERAGQRGWTIEYARHFFANVAEPTFERYAADYRSVAHIIVRNDAYTPR